ncbi:MAG: PQQ-binding-like beta-propeller repeat protein [Propionibacteriaceae bacterium]|nr:PQQ-binding-like beta-propeller repeat protein [Propionibacteriaceae bacterium]
MTDDVLELDNDPRPPDASRRRLPTWSRGRTAVVAAVLVVALAAGLAAVFWPKTPPVPEVVGLQGGATEAWRLDASDAGVLGFSRQGDDWLATATASDGQEVEVRKRSMATGEILWSSTVSGEATYTLEIVDLVGTPWLSVKMPGEAVLLNRETGAMEGSVPLPQFATTTVVAFNGEPLDIPLGSAWVASSHQGTIFVGEETHIAEADGSEDSVGIIVTGTESAVTAYEAAAFEEPLWRATIPPEQTWQVPSPATVTEAGGLAFFPLVGSHWGRPTGQFGAVFSMADGSVPEWWGTPDSAVVVQDVALVTRGGQVHALDLATNEELWSTDSGVWHAHTDGGAVYLVPPSSGELKRVDLRSGRQRWATEIGSAVSPGGHYTDDTNKGFWQGDPLLIRTNDDGQRMLIRVDASTGRTVMTREVDPEAELTLYNGEGQLLLVSRVWPDAGEAPEPAVDTVTALDPSSGEPLWEQEFSGGVAVLARHLVSFEGDPLTRTGVVKVYR